MDLYLKTILDIGIIRIRWGFDSPRKDMYPYCSSTMVQYTTTYHIDDVEKFVIDEGKAFTLS